MINRVVKGLAAKLTDRAGIQALIEMPDDEPKPEVAVAKGANKKAEAEATARSEAAKAIPEATSNLLEPFFGQGRGQSGIPARLPESPQSMAAAGLG